MKARDVLADDVGIGWPVMSECCLVSRKANSSQVVCQSIEPHINDLALIAWHRNSPRCYTRTHNARDGKVPQALANDAQHLRAPAGWHDKIRVLVDVREQAIAIRRKGEKVVLLFQPLRFD